MKQICTVLLHEGTDQDNFLNEVMDDHCHCLNECEHIPDVVVLSVNQTEIEAIKNHSSVKELIVEPQAHPADLPPFFSKTRTFTTELPSASLDVKNFGSLQFYFFNDQVKSAPGVKVGAHQWQGNPQPINDTSPSIFGTYKSCWTGKNVDIVTLEVYSEVLYNNIQNTHPDFKKLDNPSESKFIPTNWTGLFNTKNTSQTTTSALLTSHAIGVLSAASGVYSGYAKNASIRVIYNDLFGTVAAINSVIAWHNSKPINPETGVKNPTILIYEFQYFKNSVYYKIDDILSLTYYNNSTKSLVTVNRPGTNWLNNFTPFIEANCNIKRVQVNNVYHWCVGFTDSDEFSALKNAINAATNAGIINVVVAGNQGGVYVKRSDTNHTDAKITVKAGAISFVATPELSGTTWRFTMSTNPPTSLVTEFPVLQSFGPHGSETGIDIAAAQNSETYPILDYYSNRGPGIDIAGLGAQTLTAAPEILYADGTYWGMFTGTSCAAPTVVGVLACILEKYYYYYGVWPTPAQAKELLLLESKKNVLSNPTSTTWSSVPTPSSAITSSEIIYGKLPLMIIQNNTGVNGGVILNELVGTPNRRAFLDNNIVKHGLNRTSRPISGFVYPRSKIKR
jgi:hypothetical protein